MSSWFDDDYYDADEEHEKYVWNKDSLARMKDSSFKIELELRQFFEISNFLIVNELENNAISNNIEIQAVLYQTRRNKWRNTRIDQVILSEWLGRKQNFRQFYLKIQELQPSSTKDKPVTDNEVLAVQSLLKSWIDEVTVASLDNFAPWQGVIFFYSLESLTAALVNLLSNTRVQSHSDVLNQFRSLFLTSRFAGLHFAPIDFLMRIRDGSWCYDNNSPTPYLINYCHNIAQITQDKERRRGYITYLHLIHTISELYRYKSTLPFLMNSKASLRNNGVLFWNLQLPIKLWLEVLICQIIGPDIFTDLIKMTSHRLDIIHRTEIPSLKLRWQVMHDAGIINIKKRGLSKKTEAIFQIIRNNPLGI